MEIGRLDSTVRSSLWRNNTVLVQALGLSPVLAVSGTVTNGIGLGLATFVVTVGACFIASLTRITTMDTWRFVIFMTIIAALTSLVELFFQVALYPLYRSLGIYLPLICCNAAILFRIETYSRHVPPVTALFDGLQTATGFLCVIVLFSALREWLSLGTVLSNAELLTPFSGDIDQGPISTNVNSDSFRLTLLQPGAFILLGLVIALKNLLDSGFQKPSELANKDHNDFESTPAED